MEKNCCFLNDKLIQLYKNVPATIVQVGACDGAINDPIYGLIKNQIQTNTVVLIEPQLELIPVLRDNYAFHKDARIENVAIGNPGYLVLYRLRQEYWGKFIRRYLKDQPIYRVPSGFVSSDYQHVVKHIEGNLPNDIHVEDTIEEIKVPSKKLREVLEHHKIKKIDLLQVDAEGFDDVVIYNCDIDLYKPRIINFEHMHLSLEKRSKLHDFFREQGYKIYEYSKSDTIACIE